MEELLKNICFFLNTFFNRSFSFILIFFCFPLVVFSQSIEITSSPNPVGSGARAVGMGGAFISIADDATAASWNPAGLIQLEKPEFSFVGNFFSNIEDNLFLVDSEASGQQSVSDWHINYMSVTHPLVLFNRNMVVSVSYQHLYNFSREWDFPFTLNTETTSNPLNIHIKNSGDLSALGLAWCIQATPDISFGVTLNIWDRWPGKNDWEEIYKDFGIGTHTITSQKFVRDYYSKYKFMFQGVNANIGLLWEISKTLKLGLVVKTPFNAEIIRNSVYRSSITFPDYPDANYTDYNKYTTKETMKMPLSWGFGISKRFTKNIVLALDVYRTEWQEFVYIDSQGIERSPISGLKINESDVNATHQVRVGMEYRVNRNDYIIPLRTGIFYDPAPAEGNSDDYYGFSIGTGFNTKRYSFDVAYQLRIGNDVGDSLLKSFGFSQDIFESQFLLSVIYYFQ
jgi:long-subunit fatty acid transport protein